MWQMGNIGSFFCSYNIGCIARFMNNRWNRFILVLLTEPRSEERGRNTEWSYHRKFLGIRFLKDFSLTAMSYTVKGGRNHPVAIVEEPLYHVTPKLLNDACVSSLNHPLQFVKVKTVSSVRVLNSVLFCASLKKTDDIFQWGYWDT